MYKHEQNCLNRMSERLERVLEITSNFQHLQVSVMHKSYMSILKVKMMSYYSEGIHETSPRMQSNIWQIIQTV